MLFIALKGDSEKTRISIAIFGRDIIIQKGIKKRRLKFTWNIRKKVGKFREFPSIV